MKLSDFILLDEEDKKLAVLHEGVLIGKRKKKECMVFLFQLNSFYVETFCNLQTKAVVQFRIFDHTRLLRPYLETIAIDELLKN
jgi:hypothetical protein